MPVLEASLGSCAEGSRWHARELALCDSLSGVTTRASIDAAPELLVRIGRQAYLPAPTELWPEVIGRAIEAVESADFLTERQRQDIFYNNAARFLRLEEGNNRE